MLVPCITLTCALPIGWPDVLSVTVPTTSVRFATDVVGTVTDSTSGQPIGNAQVSVMQGTSIVLNTITDDFGRYRAHNLGVGTYTVSVHAIGFHAQSHSITIDGSSGAIRVDFQMPTVVINLSAVEVTAATPIA